MTALRTYRPVLTAFLLAVYAFIAAPVQLWHHHHHYISKASQKPVSPDSKNDILSQGTNASWEGDCQLCSHKYSSYNEVQFIQFEASRLVTAAKNGCCPLQLISASFVRLPNKGPPAIS